MSRFKASKIITNSGRSRRWVVVDSEGEVPGITFRWKDPNLNEKRARTVCRWLNEGAEMDRIAAEVEE